jgi:hypothetical protein
MPDPSDLFATIDELAQAEPMGEEEELMLRMEAVSKVCGRKGAGKKEKKKKKAGDAKPRRSIEKPKRPKRQPMQS